jgi:DNA end-binding protein Ku
MVLETMYWPDEIRPAEFEEVDSGVKIRPQEVEMARNLIENLTQDFDATQFTDEYRQALLGIVEKKVAGEEIEVMPEAEPTRVVDLMEALKQSVEATKSKASATGSGSGSRRGTKAAAASASDEDEDEAAAKPRPKRARRAS